MTDSKRWWTRDSVVAGAIFVIAALLRAIHLHQLSIHDPFYALPSVDGAVYDAWAREIVAGDWKGEGVLFMGPGYPAFMAAVYGVFGPSLPALKAIQVGLGALSCVLVWGVARELFDRRVAAIAGFVAAGHGMLIFYGGTVMVVNLQVPLVVGLVWALIRTFAKPTLPGWALCGALVGLSVLARQTVLLVAPIVALWILLGPSGGFSLRRRLAFATTFGGVICLMILPFTIRNYVVGDDLVLLNSTGGANFYMGNQRNADGTWQVPSLGTGTRIDNPRGMQQAFTSVAERETGRTLKASEVSSYWLGRGLEEIRADPWRWIRLEVRKLGHFVNAYEVWNNRSFEVSREFSWVLRLPLLGFGVIGPLGLLGLFLSLGRRRELVPVYAVIGAYLVSGLLFFVLSRYRMPAAILLTPFAGFAVLRLADGFRRADWGNLALQGAALAGLVAIVHLPIASENRMHMAYYNLGNKFRELERWDEAIAAYRTSLEAVPGAISTHNNLAIALEHALRKEEAIEEWKIVGVLAMRHGDRLRMERAARHLRELGVPIPESTPAPGASPSDEAPQDPSSRPRRPGPP